MADNDKDVVDNKVVLNEGQLNSELKKNEIPEAQDQSANYPKEELFKQNIQMGESAQAADEESLQEFGSQSTDEKASVFDHVESAKQINSVNANPNQNGNTANNLSTNETSNISSNNSSSHSFYVSGPLNGSVVQDYENNVTPVHGENNAYSFQANFNNHDLNSVASNLSSSSDSPIDNVASDPNLNVENAKGKEDSAIPLNINASLTDNDGSESITIEIQNIPVGAVLSDGVNAFSATELVTSIDVSEWNLDSLSITPVANSNEDFDLVVKATSTEQANADTSSVSSILSVTVDSVNDTPDDISLEGDVIYENSEGGVVGSISTHDVDVNDSHTYSVSDDHFEVVDGKLQLKDGVSLDYESEQSIELEVTSTDSQGASITETLTINVQNVNEAPDGINLSNLSFDENASGVIIGTVTTSDKDLNDTHTYSVSDERFEVVADGEGNMQLKLKDGNSLNYEKDSSVEITITSTDEAGLSTSQEFTVYVNDVNDFNIISGTNDADLLRGTSSDDKIEALDGNDRIYAGEGHDAIYGGDGDDVLSAQGGNDEVYGGDGNDRIYGGDGENVLDGGEGADRIYGHQGGTDEIHGGAGDDYIYMDGNDSVDGGAGTDRVYTYGEEEVSINMGDASVEQVYAQSDADLDVDASSAEQGVYVRARGGDDDIKGSDHDDRIFGGDGENVLDGGEGADRIYGHQGGTDEIHGGAGDDYIYMDGNDSVDGGAGTDRVYTYGEEEVSINMGDASVEQVYAQSDADLGVDASSAEQGVYVRARGGDDDIKGSDHDDRIFGGDGENVLDGGEGADRIYGHQGGTDEIHGGAGDDYIYMDGNDSVDGGAGTDRVYTYGEEEVSINMGDASVEQVYAQSDADLDVDASSAEQGVYVRARGGDDDIKGSDHDDRIFGGDGENVLDGGEGADRIYGHQGGTDEIHGGAGDDYIYMDGNDSVDGGAGTDRVYTYGEEEVSINMGDASVEQVYAQSDADLDVDASSAEQGVYVRARGGDDDIKGSTYNDNIGGGSGEDNIIGDAGNDYLYGQGGNDIIKGGSGDDRLYGQEGDDHLEGGTGNDRMLGGDGDDIFVVGEGSDIVYGDDGNDLFILDSLGGNDTIYGGSGGGWSDIIDINVSPQDTGDSENPWSIEVNGEQVDFDLADGIIDVGSDAAGVISFADGTEVAFEGVEQIQW